MSSLFVKLKIFKQTLFPRLLYSKPLSWWRLLNFPHSRVTELISFDFQYCFYMCGLGQGCHGHFCMCVASVRSATFTRRTCKVVFRRTKCTGPYSKPQNYQSLLFYGLARELWHFLAWGSIYVGYFRAYRTIKTDGSI